MKAEPIFRLLPMMDDEVTVSLSEIDYKELFLSRTEWMGEKKTTNDFLDAHHEWIKAGTLNTMTGLELFPHKSIINGCTEALTDYHWHFRNKRLRIFRREYQYTTMSAETFTFVDEDELREGDALIVSQPFFWFGVEHPDFDSTMKRCCELNIPVLVDCCYYGMCHDIDFRLDYPCIVAVCFSLSKTFGSGTFRTGTLFSKDGAPSHIQTLQDWNYTSQVAAVISMKLMEQFSADFIVNKYRSTHLELCEEYGIQSTNSIILGNGDHPYDDTWPAKFSKFDYNGKEIWKWGLRDVLRERWNINNSTTP